MKNDGIAYHQILPGHAIDFKNTTILAEDKAYWPRVIKEGIEIKKFKPTERANMQADYEIDPIWNIHLGFGICRVRFTRRFLGFREKCKYKMKIQTGNKICSVLF